MSTPEERMRALRWGAELLEVMLQDVHVPANTAERAKALVRSYPTPTALNVLLASGARHLPVEIGSAIDDARVLFEDMQLHGIGSATTRHHLSYTLRHFPLLHASQRARDGLRGLHDWLEPEGNPGTAPLATPDPGQQAVARECAPSPNMKRPLT
jgi:hypothetical protein